jgi:long-chain acyl-CoA synthetase
MVRLAPVASAGPGEGEIVVYGPNVMVGYHERPDETAGAIGPDRGLHTGDLGTIDDDGYLYITGRIKEQYKLENGKYVMPAPLEQALALSPYISNVMLYGANRPYNVALVAIDVAAVKAWAAREGVTIGADLATDPAVRRLIAGELERGSADWKGFERPRDFAIVAADFAIADDTLTPSLKIKRRGVLARYGAMLEALYPRMPTTTAPSPAPRAEAR